jgi:hypothetical protein
MTESGTADGMDIAAARTGQLFQLLASGEGDLADVAGSYSEIERDLKTAGFDLKEFLPRDESEALDFAVPDWAARFFKSYVKIVRGAICDKGGDLHKQVASAMTSGVTSLLGVLAVGLAIPAGAVVILAPIAATLLVLGLDAFCTLDT